MFYFQKHFLIFSFRKLCQLSTNVWESKNFLPLILLKFYNRDFNHCKQYSKQIHIANIQHLNNSIKAKQRHLQINLKISFFCSCQITQALNANKMNPFRILFILYFLKLSYGSKLQSILLKFFSYLHLVNHTLYITLSFLQSPLRGQSIQSTLTLQLHLRCFFLKNLFVMPFDFL